ncbi:MAG: 4'-phosphopantetheinyl transferase superfamily protein [Planctomycetes bacterium]|nr:4'-phosphopantetheinyl transferase superfamily protein [Planctomycetota bacterium]
MWSLKESYAKMIGLGLALDPKSYRLVFRYGAIGVHRDETATFRLYRQFPGYSLAVCSRNSTLPDGTVELTPELFRAGLYGKINRIRVTDGRE